MRPQRGSACLSQQAQKTHLSGFATELKCDLGLRHAKLKLLRTINHTLPTLDTAISYMLAQVWSYLHQDTSVLLQQSIGRNAQKWGKSGAAHLLFLVIKKIWI